MWVVSTQVLASQADPKGAQREAWTRRSFIRKPSISELAANAPDMMLLELRQRFLVPGFPSPPALLVLVSRGHLSPPSVNGRDRLNAQLAPSPKPNTLFILNSYI